MTDDPIDLKKERARRSEDCRDWTPLDALKDMVEAIESGEFDVDKIFIGARTVPKDGRVMYPFRAAGMEHIEVLGLLSKHLAMQHGDVYVPDE